MKPKEEKEASEVLMESRKDDNEKLMWHLLPLSLMKPVVEIFQYGLKKYKKEGSWKELDNGYIRYRNAFFRHLEAHESGQFKDPESGFPHIQHCAWNALAMMYFSLKFSKNKEDEIQGSLRQH